MRVSNCLLLLAGLVAVACLLLGPVGAVFADGGATDDAKPSAWIGPPTPPDLTPCKFKRVLLTSWKALDEDEKGVCDALGWATHGLCAFFDHCESYSNAALLGSEIWGYTWADDSQFCLGDECSSVDTAGVSSEIVRYTINPTAGCSATISARLDQQFTWRIQGRGHVEVAVAGSMSCTGSDLVFPCPTIGGGKSAYVGDRARCAPTSPSGTVTIGQAPFVVTIPLSVLSEPSLPVDEGVIAHRGANIAPPVPLTGAGETVVFRGFAKVRSYADEPLTGDADVEGWIRDADPGFTADLVCKGQPLCMASTASTCKSE